MKRNYILFILIVLILLFNYSCKQGGEKKTEGSVSENDTVSVKIETLNKLISSDSANPENYYKRSLYYLENKDINKALSDIGRAIELNDREAEYFVTLADLYLALGKIPNCMEALKKAEELDPENKGALLKLAEVYLILRDYQNTFNYTGKALDIDLHNPVAYFIRGYAYMEQGDTTLAIKSFQAAADQDQNYYNAYIELGLLYSSLKNPLATGYFEAAIKIEPNRTEAYYLLGMTYQEMEIIPKAVETYEKLLVLAPDYKEVHYNLGYLNLVYIHDFETAIMYFNKAISLDPKYTDAYFNRGYSYELAGDSENARKDYLKALEITPNYERAVTGLNRLDSL